MKLKCDILKANPEYDISEDIKRLLTLKKG